jgi:hypothetical protein
MTEGNVRWRTVNLDDPTFEILARVAKRDNRSIAGQIRQMLKITEGESAVPCIENNTNTPVSQEPVR